jgi:hypothetical protein
MSYEICPADPLRRLPHQSAVREGRETNRGKIDEREKGN